MADGKLQCDTIYSITHNKDGTIKTKDMEAFIPIEHLHVVLTALEVEHPDKTFIVTHH